MANKISDYKKKIKELKGIAVEDNKTELVITAIELYEVFDVKQSSMYTCCKALKDMMLEGDKILCDPPTPSGYSSKLKVKYNLVNMDNRKSYFKPSKRGRPSENFTYLEIQQLVETYLEDKYVEYNYLNKQKCYQIKNQNWTIYLLDSLNTDNAFKVRIFDLINSGECNNKLTIVFKNFKKEKHFWNLISPKIKKDFNITYLSYKEGKVREIQ